MIWLLVITAGGAIGEEFCAVSIEVIRPGGEFVTAPVELLGPDGKVVEKILAIDGKAQFCDFGFGEHTVRIGNDCGFVTLHRIRMVYGVAQSIRAILNPCVIGGDGGVFPPSCRVYIRVVTQDGRKLDSADVFLRGGKRITRGDRYGRMYFAIRRGTNDEYRVSAAGHSDKFLRLSCDAVDTIEVAVELRPMPLQE